METLQNQLMLSFGIFQPPSRETGIFRPLSRGTGIDTTLPENLTDLSLRSETAVRPEVKLPAEPRKRRPKCRMAALDNMEVVPENACTTSRHDVYPNVTPVNPTVKQEIFDSPPDEELRKWRRKGSLVRVNSHPVRAAESALTEEVVHVMVHRDADS
ncbi:hypothetical protein JTB14_011313 [Gonioctena quinquepunctata]|nr:hypothetical protein JTB14_011313 [Gonioctena quinquepunctata]